MELKLQLVDTAGRGRRVLTSCLSSFSSPGTLGDVSGGSFFFKNVVRKSDQSRKLQSNKNKVPKFASNIYFNAGFSVARRPLGGIAVVLKWNAETEIEFVSQ